MKYSQSNYIENKVVGEDSIRLICAYFEKLPERKKGRIEIIINYTNRSELSGNDKEVIDVILVQKKPISKIEFKYESDDWHTHLFLSMRDQFASSSHYGLYYWISSDDDVWFNATRAQMQDLMEAIPGTPSISRFFNSFGLPVSIVVSCCTTVGVVYLLRFLTHKIGFQVTESMIKLIIICLLLVLLLTFISTRDFLTRTYPVVDFDLFKTREKYRTKIWRIFWWILAAIVIPILLARFF